jgi:hypothetical protein
LAVDTDRTDQDVVLEHRDNKKRSHAAQFHSSHGKRIAFRIVAELCAIQNMDGAWSAKNLRKSGAWGRSNRSAPEEFFKTCWRIMRRDGAKRTVLIPEHMTKAGAADARSVLQHGLEHRLKIAGGG